MPRPDLTFFYGITYNGFRIPGIHKKNFNIEPIYSPDDRNIRFYRHTLEVEFIITENDVSGGGTFRGIDHALPAIKNLLMTPGQLLVIDNAGFGSLAITGEPIPGTPTTALPLSGTAVRILTDALYGPKPVSFVTRPLASNRAYACKWICVFHIFPCNDDFESLVLSFRSKVNLSYNEDGLLVRTVSGEFELPGNDPRLGRLPIQPLLREIIYTRLPFLNRNPAYFRTNEFELSEDKKFCVFRITDVEIPTENPFFPYCTKMRANHRINGALLPGRSWTEPGGWFTWRNSISLDVTIRPELHPTLGRFLSWLAFISILQDRLSKLAGSVTASSVDNINGTQSEIRNRYVILSVELDESIYSRDFHFQVDYIIFNGPSQILLNSRMFHPLANVTWEDWANSMGNTTVKPTRRSGFLYSYNLGSNPCVSGQYFDVLNTPADGPYADLPPIRVDPNPSIVKFLDIDSYTDPASSYVHFDNNYQLEENPAYVVHHKNIPQDDSYYRAVYKDPYRSDQVGWEIEDYANAPQYNPYDKDKFAVVQARGLNTYRVRVRGSAIRVGHPIPMPRLISFGSQPCYRSAESRWMQKQAALTATGRPVFAAAWDLVYDLPGRPSTLVGGQADLMKQLQSGSEAIAAEYMG